VQFDDAVRLDVRYIQTWTLLLDLKILAKTVREVLACRGSV
jgi:lipopolysaccharide/colanic/teichoic acid biosynthesis glycosyltransferase